MSHRRPSRRRWGRFLELLVMSASCAVLGAMVVIGLLVVLTAFGVVRVEVTMR